LSTCITQVMEWCMQHKSNHGKRLLPEHTACK
jgi:hypothetical protein